MTLSEELEEVGRRKEGWNGYNALPPDPRAIYAAYVWLSGWYGLEDIDPDPYERAGERPHITSSALGEVVLEWWMEDRNLVVYIRPMNPNFDLSYSRAGSGTCYMDMEGEISSEGDWTHLWNWLIGWTPEKQKAWSKISSGENT